MKNNIIYVAVICSVMSLASCDSEDAKPISKVASYPSSLYGAWAWPCIEDYDTEGTNFPLYRQQKRSYGENSTYAFERTVYQDSSCTGEPVAKGVHKGTYNIVNVIESHPTNPVPYVEVDYEITEIIFEGNKPLAATTASRNRHVVGFQFYGIAKVLPEVGQLHIGWVGEMENDVLLRPTQFDEILHKSRILQPTYSTVLASKQYNTTSISDVAGKWSENCVYKGEYSGVFYYSAWKYEIIAPATYSEMQGLYDNDTCSGVEISYYKYPGTIAINTSVANATNGVGATNLEGVSGLHITVTFAATESILSADPNMPTLTEYGPPTTMYDIMISDPESEYLFVTGLWSKSPTNVVNDIYVREP